MAINTAPIARRLIAFSLAAASVSSAQARPAFSIGQPPLWEFDAALLATLRGDADANTPMLTASIHHAIINPVTGLLGAAAEGFVGAHSSIGARLLVESKALALSGGVDVSSNAHSIAPVFSYQTALRRGGLIGGGSMLRLDWLPTRSQSVAVGISVPLFRPLAGRTRPRETHIPLAVSDVAVRMPPGATRIDRASVGRIRDAAELVAAFSNAYSDRAEAIVANTPRTYVDAIRGYDDAIVRTFAAGSGETTTARRIAEHARAIVLGRVLLPIDSLFGQAKEDPRNLGPLVHGAEAAFARWLSDSADVPAPRQADLARAFAGWMDAVTAVYERMLSDAGDSRLVWMPLELALHPDQFDDQAQMDSLIARAVGHPFSDQNGLTYLRSSDLPLEIARSIYAARTYHVLWTHDFTGRRPSGAVDNVAYSMVADAYLPALTAAVKRYDSTGVLPTYVILQDEFFYEPRGNRMWMTILEDPLHASMHLPGDNDAREAHLRARQQELRAAVAASRRLQRDAAASGDAGRWLSRIVKVNVNIVEPADFSFRSSHIIPGIPFTLDNIARDHRKLVLYDLTEAAPYRGAMLIMGIGIGEHYSSATWEDRGYRVRGPATLEARRAVRDALLRNGFSDEDIPEPLRAVASVKGAERRMNAGDYVGRALQVHNEVGFGRKESSVARALLYNLAPPGSVIIVPDPMWLSDTWAGMLVAAAARGCRVYIIAPAAANAPSPQAPLMSVQHDVLARVLHLRDLLGARIRASGDELRVGIFAAHADVDAAAGRAREVREGLARAPWILDVIPFDARTLAVLQRAEREVASHANGTELAHDEKPRAPQLHQKSQLIARPGAIAALVRQPGWDVVLAQTIRVQAEATARFAEQLGYTDPDVDTTATRRNDALLRGYEQTLSAAERKRTSFYFSVGSQNQDARGIVLDGETTLIVSGAQASAGLADLFFLMARSTWIESEPELAAFNPPSKGFMRRLAWRIRVAF